MRRRLRAGEGQQGTANETPQHTERKDGDDSENDEGSLPSIRFSLLHAHGACALLHVRAVGSDLGHQVILCR